MDGVSVDSLFLFGRSLGGICAVETAMNYPARGLILESVFTNSADMSRTVFPFIPLGMRFDPNWTLRGKSLT